MERKFKENDFFIFQNAKTEFSIVTFWNIIYFFHISYTFIWLFVLIEDIKTCSLFSKGNSNYSFSSTRPCKCQNLSSNCSFPNIHLLYCKSMFAYEYEAWKGCISLYSFFVEYLCTVLLISNFDCPICFSVHTFSRKFLMSHKNKNINRYAHSSK